MFGFTSRLLTLLFPITFCVASEETRYSQYDEDTDLLGYVELVEELNLRKRVNVLFKNSQSIFDGFQIGFVNVSSGNLTFSRRDLVVPNCGIFQLNRTYDSRNMHNLDFGPGWRLSINEEIVKVKGVPWYIDQTGTIRKLQQIDDGSFTYNEDPKIGQINLTLSDNQATLTRKDGSTRIFMRISSKDRFQLTSIQRHHCDQLHFKYHRGKISEVQSQNGILFSIKRNKLGRIIEARDSFNRIIEYQYDYKGQLTSVIDLVGNQWRYKYDEMGKLIEAIAPNGEEYLSVDFDLHGRVSRTASGQTFNYLYKEEVTFVYNENTQWFKFTQNKEGATIGFDSSSSINWNLELDHENRIRSMTYNSNTYLFKYNENGLIYTITQKDTTNQNVSTFSYDKQNRIKGIYRNSEDWLDVHHGVNEIQLFGPNINLYIEHNTGQIYTINNGSHQISVQRDPNNDITMIRNNYNTVRFTRDPLQRITSTNFNGKHTSHYFYNLLGNRHMLDIGQFGYVEYLHDSSGNIVKTHVVNQHRQSLVQKLDIGKMNRVKQIVFEGSDTISIIYNKSGQPVQFVSKFDTVIAKYHGSGRLKSLRSTHSDTLVSFSDSPSKSARQRTLLRNVLMQDSTQFLQAGHNLVVFDELSFEPTILKNELLIGGLVRQAIALIEVSDSLAKENLEDSILEFDKPSNPVFQPTEYRSTNCCIPCNHGNCTSCGQEVQGSYGFCYCYPPFQIDHSADDSNTVGETGNNSGEDSDKDEIIEKIQKEYRDKDIIVPDSDDFISELESDHFITSEYNSGHYKYFISVGMDDVAEQVRADYNQLIDNDPSTDYGLIISSGYRNPVHNDSEEVDGARESKHQYGRAVDFDTPEDDRPPGISERELLNYIELAATRAGRIVIRYPGYVHVQW